MMVDRKPYAIFADPAAADLCRAVLPKSLSALIRTDACALPGIVCLAAVTMAGARSSFGATLDSCGLHGVPLIEIDPADPAPMIDDLMILLVGRLRQSETETAQSRNDAAMLRRENISTAGRFREIESFLYSLGNPQVSRSLSWDPAGQICRLPPGAPVIQPLPINIVSVTAVELWLPEVMRNGDHGLSVAIVDSAGARHLLRQSEDHLRLGAGWMRFALDAPVPGEARNCALLLLNEGPGTLAVGMGMRMPDARFAAQGGDMPGDQVVALRVWKALAGAALPTGDSGALIDAERDHAACFLTPSSLPRPEVFSMPRSATDYVTADYWEAEDAIIVHPSRSGAVCAILRDVPLAGLRQLTAVVTVGHAQSPTLNFALGVAPRGKLGRDGYWQAHVGPWVHGLPPHGWAQVHCIPSEPIDRADIFLAASLAQDVPNDLSWGMFRGLRAVTAAPVPTGDA